jgi:putative membrane protein (TIGR04086 family)
MEKQKEIWVRALLVLLFMAVMTVALLLAGAAVVYYRDLSSKMAYLMIYAIYAIVGFAGGFVTGKVMKVRKFLWGIAAGLVYFGCLILVSLIANGGAIADAFQVLLSFVLIEVSAMIGGMIS